MESKMTRGEVCKLSNREAIIEALDIDRWKDASTIAEIADLSEQELAELGHGARTFLLSKLG